MNSTRQKLLGITLAMLAGSVSLSFADQYLSPRAQLESGVAPEDILCRDSHVLVLRTNGNAACVTERTAEKMNWEKIISTKTIDVTSEVHIDDVTSEVHIDDVTSEVHIDDVTSEVLVDDSATTVTLDEMDSIKSAPLLENVEVLTWDASDVVASEFQTSSFMGTEWPHTSISIPSQVAMNTPFEVSFSWQYFVGEGEDRETAIDSKYNHVHNFNSDIRLSLLASVEFVNYKELGYKVVSERVDNSNLHFMSYAKAVSYNEDINTDTYIFKVTGPIPEYTHEMGVGVISSYSNPPPFHATSNGNTVTFVSGRLLYDPAQPSPKCGERCQYWKDNVKDDIEFDYLYKYVTSNEITGTDRINFRGDFYNYYHHNDGATLKDFIEKESGHSSFRYMSSADITANIDEAIKFIDAGVKKREKLEEYGVPLDVKLVGEMLLEIKQIKGIDIAEIIKGYGFPDWFVDDIYQKYPELKTQDFQLITPLVFSH